MRFLKKIKVELPHDPAIAPEHIPRENANSKSYAHPNVRSSTAYNRQDMGATQMPTDRQVGKEDAVDTRRETVRSHRQQ